MNADQDRPAPLEDRTDEFREALDRLVGKSVARFREAARGLTPRSCPICRYHGLFAPFGMPPRLDARCPSCTSLERHRLLALVLQRGDLVNSTHRLLHFAPEKPLQKLLAAMAGTYETADIRTSARTDHVLNIEALDLPDASYDRIICNHVLEHVDDGLALAELFRVLRPGGMLFLTTPVVEGWSQTHEDRSILDPLDRLLNFGQADHVRLYGRDVRDRIRKAGFLLEEHTAVEPDVRNHGLWRGETVFLAHRPSEEESVKTFRKAASKPKAAKRRTATGREDV